MVFRINRVMNDIKSRITTVINLCVETFKKIKHKTSSGTLLFLADIGKVAVLNGVQTNGAKILQILKTLLAINT